MNEPDTDRAAEPGTEPENDTRETPVSGDPPEDGTLGGYFSVHERPPAFEGSDGRPYTVSVEVEQVGDLTHPFAAYLVFPRWTHDGSSVEGHVQTPLLARARSRGDAVDEVGTLSLERVKELLEEAIHRSWGVHRDARFEDPGTEGPSAENPSAEGPP